MAVCEDAAGASTGSDAAGASVSLTGASVSRRERVAKDWRSCATVPAGTTSRRSNGELRWLLGAVSPRSSRSVPRCHGGDKLGGPCSEIVFVNRVDQTRLVDCATAQDGIYTSYAKDAPLAPCLLGVDTKVDMCNENAPLNVIVWVAPEQRVAC